MQLQGTARSFFTLFEQFKERYCQARLDECTQDDQTSRQAYQTKLLQIKQPFSSQDKQECQEQLDSILITAQESLDKNLFLAGKDYSMADILMTCLLVRLKDAGKDKINTLGTIKRNLSNHPQIQDYFKRVQSRPSFQKTFSGSQFAKVFGLMVFRDIPSLFLSKLTGRY